MAILLSLCLGLFLAEAVVSLIDDSLILLSDNHVFKPLRGILFVFTTLVAVVIYGLMGLTPMVPKRLFLPIALFNPVAGLLAVPIVIFFLGRIQQVGWFISFCQVVLGLSILYCVQGGLKFRWPLVPPTRLEARRFSWRNLSLFLVVNAFVLVPAVGAYLVFCAALAIDHFSEGFMALRPAGLTVRVKKYVRDDGKAIELVPMSHIGESDFYQMLSRSFPTNATILMEGVTDSRNLLTNKISYKRMAHSLGVSEQQMEFRPRGRLVRADVDVEQFETSTLDFLNAVMLFHSKGLNPGTVLELIHYSPPPSFEKRLFDDLLGKRNRHLVNEIHARLSQAENIVVPWGVAHMPEIAREIQKSGFRLVETRERVVIRFRAPGNKNVDDINGEGSDKPK